MASLAASLLAAPDAHAGSYTPAYSGGFHTALGGQQGTPGTYSDSGGSSGYGGSGSVPGGSASCQKPISTTLTWQPAYTGEPAPPPSSVIITETCTAKSQTLASGSDTAKCDDGLGQAGSVQSVNGVAQYSSPPNSQMIGYFAQVSASDVRYSVWKGSSLSVTPTASVSGTGAASSAASVLYTASASPVTITPYGATPDGHGGWDVLVGLKVSPFLSGIPTSCTVSNYQWTVTGTTMQSWTVSSDSTHTTEVDGSGPLNIADPGWFWNDSKQTSETITCTATVTPPTGQGKPFPVTVSQKVGVYLPAWSGKGLGGQMTVDAKYPAAANTGDFCLYASPAPTQPGGMTWEATLAPPQSSPVTFDKGNIYLVQVVTPSVGYIDKSNQQWESIFQGQLGIDSFWPYQHGWATYEDDPYEPFYVSFDSPGLDLTALQAIYGSYMSSFEDYIMFQPYGTTQYVPLGNFKWSVNAGDTIPSTNNWSNFKNPAGIVTPSGTPVGFTPSNSYPSWAQNSGNAPIAFKKF